MLKIGQTKVYYGPNPCSLTPVVHVQLQIEDTYHRELFRASQCLIRLFPHWIRLTDNDKRGAEEVLLDTIVQWARAALNEQRGYIDSSGYIKSSSNPSVWLGYHHPHISIRAISLSVEAILACAKLPKIKQQHFSSALEQLWTICRQHHPSVQVRLLEQGARYLDLPPILPFLPGSQIWQFGWGACSRVFSDTMSDEDGHIGSRLSYSKLKNKALFFELGLPTPDYVVVNAQQELASAVKRVSYPCVTKPVFGAGGKGITTDIKNFEELDQGFLYAKKSRVNDVQVMLESFVEGDDYRLMVVDGELLVALQRRASVITGDAKHTVKELINQLNNKRMKEDSFLKQVEIDSTLTDYLIKQNVAMDNILPKGKVITLSCVSNYSAGGEIFDVSHKVHPQIVSMAEMIAQTSGIYTIGIDYIAKDITVPHQDGNGYFTEYNNLLDLSLVKLVSNPSAALAKIIGPVPARIPLVIVILDHANLDNAKNHLVEIQIGKNMGWVCGQHVVIGDVRLQKCHGSGWGTIEVLLRNKTLKAALLICSLQDIEKNGLPVDKADAIHISRISIPDDWHRVIQSTTSYLEYYDDLEVALASSIEQLSKPIKQPVVS